MFPNGVSEWISEVFMWKMKMYTYPVEDEPVNNGEDGGETHREEEAGADPAVLRGAEDGLGDCNDGGATKD